MATIFFQGSINEAIQLSVTSRKPLVCFVTDEEEGPSTSWEEDYLQNGEIAPALNSQAVTIRLVAGSVEAGYLSAFCPVDTVPTVLVIKNGTVAENVSGIMDKESFVRRIIKAIETDTPIQGGAQTTDSHVELTAPASSAATQPPTSTSTLFTPDSSRASSKSPDSAARNAARVAALAQQTRDRIARLRESAPTSGTASPSTTSTVNTPPSDPESPPVMMNDNAIHAARSASSSREIVPLVSPDVIITDTVSDNARRAAQLASPPREPTPTVTSTPSDEESAASKNAARIASMAQQTRERIAKIKERKEVEEKELVKKREIQRREGVKANQEAVDTAKSRSNAKYKDEQRKKREEEQRERKRILDQIEADKAERREREARRKAVEKSLAENMAEEERVAAIIPLADDTASINVSAECALSFRLLDGTSIRAKFPSSNTIGNDVRKWVDANRTDGDQPYTLTRVRPPQPAKKITSETETLQDLNLTPNASLILVPLGGSRTVSAYAPPVTGWLMSFFYMIWNFIKTLLGLNHTSPNVGRQEEKQADVVPESSTLGREDTDIETANDDEKKDKGKRRVWTLHDDDTKRSVFYNGNQLDFEPRKDDE